MNEDNTKDAKAGWMRAKGPMASAICTLLDVGWRLPQPTKCPPPRDDEQADEIVNEQAGDGAATVAHTTTRRYDQGQENVVVHINGFVVVASVSYLLEISYFFIPEDIELSQMKEAGAQPLPMTLKRCNSRTSIVAMIILIYPL